jgi:hypothetical protein
MRELLKHTELALKILCLIFAGLVLYELAGMVNRWNPFRGVAVPELPALTVATNSPPGAAHGANLVATMGPKGTNGASHSPATNFVQSGTATNINQLSPPMLGGSETNHGTNMGAQAGPAATATNAMTNALAKTDPQSSTTNFISAMVSTNGGTNLLLTATGTGTNAVSKPKKKKSGASSMPDMAGMNFSPFGPPGKHGPDLPPAVQARISKITDSEILGPVMHPLPMALLGIAGDVAFLRSDSGQTGLVKPGDSLDDIKLLRIGVNRVLIEQSGQKKELTMFSGYGSDSLLQNDSTNENKHL